MSAKRLFVAVPLPEPVKDELRALMAALRGSAPPLRWVTPEQLHVTLKFLGDVDDEREAPLVRALQAVRAAPWRMNLAQVGAFPGRKKPRVIWTGINSGRDQIKALAHEVEAHLVEAGFPREDRPFSAHVTLGRVRQPGDFSAFWRRADAEAFVGQTLEVTEVRLIHSRLTPQGPIYADVASFPLRGEDRDLA